MEPRSGAGDRIAAKRVPGGLGGIGRGHVQEAAGERGPPAQSACAERGVQSGGSGIQELAEAAVRAHERRAAHKEGRPGRRRLGCGGGSVADSGGRAVTGKSSRRAEAAIAAVGCLCHAPTRPQRLHTLFHRLTTRSGSPTSPGTKSGASRWAGRKYRRQSGTPWLLRELLRRSEALRSFWGFCVASMKTS